eukprot:364199-Chlamydomonas_euryale.AAC.12
MLSSASLIYPGGGYGSYAAGPRAVTAITAAFAEQEAARPPPDHALAATVPSVEGELRQAGLHPWGDIDMEPEAPPEPSISAAAAAVAALKAGVPGKDGLKPFGLKLGRDGAVRLIHRAIVGAWRARSAAPR